MTGLLLTLRDALERLEIAGLTALHFPERSLMAYTTVAEVLADPRDDRLDGLAVRTQYLLPNHSAVIRRADDGTLVYIARTP